MAKFGKIIELKKKLDLFFVDFISSFFNNLFEGKYCKYKNFIILNENKPHY